MIPTRRVSPLVAMMSILGIVPIDDIRRVVRARETKPEIPIVQFSDVPKQPLSKHVNGRKRLTRRQRKALKRK